MSEGSGGAGPPKVSVRQANVEMLRTYLEPAGLAAHLLNAWTRHERCDHSLLLSSLKEFYTPHPELGSAATHPEG